MLQIHSDENETETKGLFFAVVSCLKQGPLGTVAATFSVAVAQVMYNSGVSCPLRDICLSLCPAYQGYSG